MSDSDPGAGTRAVYRRHAARWDAERNRAFFERPWIDRALDGLAPGAAVLDLGCGSGEPIGRYLVEQGFDVTGVDAAAEMLALYAARFPSARVAQTDMRSLDLPERFDAILGWNSFFHLSMDEQRACLPRLTTHLRPGGRLLLTIGRLAGEVWGKVAGEPVFHASLSEAEYRSILWTNGAVSVDIHLQDPDCHGHSILLARRSD